MIIRTISISNYRSIKQIDDFPVSRYQAFVGENNSGKSNILASLDAFLSAGSGGIDDDCFFDVSKPIIIKVTFTGLTDKERIRWRPYLVKDELILEKQFSRSASADDEKTKINAEFHGYKAEPVDWFLSISKLEEKYGARPKWSDIVTENGLPDYFIEDGKCNKTIFSKALEKYLSENGVEYDEPDLSKTQALGLKSKVIASLPSLYLLKAISDYSAETDKRSSSTTFRRLMADLSSRILQKDDRYHELEKAYSTISLLLGQTRSEEVARLGTLKIVEDKFTEILGSLMPSVKGTSLSVETESFSSVFSRGVEIKIDDGVTTDVLAKGHGLQRCLIFTLLRTLILNQRNKLIPSGNMGETSDDRSIILAVEEPELYIHPQLCKLFSDVLREFAREDQVLFVTHSPLFVDASDSDSIALIRKDSYETGTQVCCSNARAFDGMSDKKIYKGYTRFNPEINELFFAKKVILVEGPEDRIAVTFHFQHEGRIENRLEELDYSIIVAGGKESIPFFQRVMNSFSIPYVVLHDLDIVDGISSESKAMEDRRNKEISDLLNGNRLVTFPVNLEKCFGYDGHMKDQYQAYQFFSVAENFTKEVKEVFNKIIEI